MDDTHGDTSEAPIETPIQGRVLIIAGSDSGGGAGIQADIKTCAAFGAYAMTAVTAVTAQNTVGVQRVEMLSADMVRAQIDSVLSDIGADVIKIGMLGNAEIIDAVIAAIKDSDALVVLDPVMVATSGDKLLDAAAIERMKTGLLPIVDIITPNVPEAEWLTGQSIKDTDDMSEAGRTLIDMGVYAALMKGGHLDGKSVFDILVSDEGANLMSGPRIYSRHTHGTGCTLASAVAAGLSLGASLDSAVLAARDFVFEAICTAPGFGTGHGPLNHGLARSQDDEDGISADQKGEDDTNPFAALKDLKP